VATIDQVEGTFADLIARLDVLDSRQRAMLPSRRTLQATCPDLDASWHATWRNGHFSDVVDGPVDGRPDIRIRLDSDDLVELAAGRLDFGRAMAEGRVRVDASMTDLLRLRAVL
jgi:predicted lipid carrier protein YhbT